MANNGKGWTVGTVRNKVSAIRFFHVFNHHLDPTCGNPRIKARFKTLARYRKDPTQLKLPVTHDMVITLLRRIDDRMGPARRRSRADNVTMKAAVVTAWNFLLRSSEYCSNRGETKDYCLRIGDIAFRDINDRLLDLDDLRSAHKLTIAIRGSKTDQARCGCTRTLHATGKSIDTVAAVAAIFTARPDLAAADPCTPLFKMDDGSAVKSDAVTAELKATATAMDLDLRRYATHSLRRGGATAMAAAGFSFARIRRWGRWLSDAYKTYVFGTAEDLGDLASVMATHRYTLEMPIEDFEASKSR
jgi:hypothetical protein